MELAAMVVGVAFLIAAMARAVGGGPLITIPSIRPSDPKPHFGEGCMCCREPWRGDNYHVTNYSKHSGMLPLCETCWQRLTTPERRFPYYAALRDVWVRDGSKDAPSDEALMQALRDEAEVIALGEATRRKA